MKETYIYAVSDTHCVVGTYGQSFCRLHTKSRAQVEI